MKPKLKPLFAPGIKFCLFLVASFLLFSAARAQNTSTDRQISGQVTNDKGEPLAGVSLVVTGAKRATVTDDQGKFTLSVPGSGATIEATYVGLQRQTIAVGNNEVLNIVMTGNSTGLNDVVVVGYTTQRRKDLTGALSVIDARNIRDLPVGGVDQILQGKASGVAVTTATGAPGSPIEIRIRGIGTIGNNDPLYIVDGVPTKDGINEISPNDVENVTILKDAAAASIYGSRSANGVVLITTRKGRSGVPRFSINAYTGVQQPGHLVKMANTPEYIKAFNTAAINDGRPQIPQEIIDTVPNVDWQKKTLRPAPITNLQFSVTGGSPSTTYALSGSFFRQKGLIHNSDFTRANIRSSIISNLSSKFTLGSNINIAYTQNAQVGSSGDGFGTGNPGASIVRYALFRTPATNVYNNDGTFVDLPNPSSFFGDGYNPVGLAYNTNTRYYNYSLLGNIYLQFQPIKNLFIKTDLGTNDIITDYKQFNQTWGTRAINATGSLGQSNADNFNYNWTNTATYKVEAGKSVVDLLAGTEFISNDLKGFSGSQQNYPNQLPAFQYLSNGVGTPTSPFGSTGGNESRWSIFSLLARVGYSFDDKYLASVSWRRDGSSRLQADNRYGDFFSGSVGWRIDKEAFMKDVSQISLLKIRGSIGQLGNQEIGNYAYTSTVGPNGNYSFDGALAPGYSIVANGNPNIHWERSTQQDIGLDIGILQNAFTFSADYFHKTTTGLLLSVPVPSSAGSATSPTENAGSVLNSGLELSATYNKSINRDLRYSLNANFTLLHNQVTTLADGKPIPGGRIDDNVYATLTTVGQPIGEFYMLRQEGIFQDNQEVFTHAYQGPGIRAGDVKYQDVNGDGVIDQNDRKYVGSAIPKFTYGLTGTVNFLNFDLSLFFQGVYGNKIYNQISTDIEGFYRAFNVTERIANKSWHGAGTSDKFPILSWSDATNNKRPSTRFLEDGSYLRLKNVQFGYNFGNRWLTSMKISSARLFVGVQNAFTITKYSGSDPELGVSANATAGGDGVRAVGIDWGTYPSSRTFTIGANINF